MALPVEVTAAIGSLRLLAGVGHCSIIVAAGSAGGWVWRYRNWNHSRGAVTWWPSSARYASSSAACG